MAQRKLEGKSLCTVEVDRSVVPPRHLGSWRAAWMALDDNTPEPTSADDAAARSSLSIDTCSGACVGHTSATGFWHLFFPLENGSVDVQANIAEGNDYRCGMAPTIQIVEGSSPLHVVVKSERIQTGGDCAVVDGEQTCWMHCAGAVEDKYQDTTREPKVGLLGVDFEGAGCGRTHVAFGKP